MEQNVKGFSEKLFIFLKKLCQVFAVVFVKNLKNDIAVNIYGRYSVKSLPFVSISWVVKNLNL